MIMRITLARGTMIERTLVVRKWLIFSIEQQREDVGHAEIDIREVRPDRHDNYAVRATRYFREILACVARKLSSFR